MLYKFKFCLMNLECRLPTLMDRLALVWFFVSRWMTQEAPIFHFKTFRCTTFIHRTRPFVPIRYIFMWLKVFQLLLLGYFTLVNKYVMAVWTSSMDLLVRNRPLAKVVWKSCPWWSLRFYELLLVLNRKSDAGVATIVDKSYGYYFITFFNVGGHVNLDLSW